MSDELKYPWDGYGETRAKAMQAWAMSVTGEAAFADAEPEPEMEALFEKLVAAAVRFGFEQRQEEIERLNCKLNALRHTNLKVCEALQIPLDGSECPGNSDPKGKPSEMLLRHVQQLRQQYGELVEMLRKHLDSFPELNMRNYEHEDVDNLNSWAVQFVLAADTKLAKHKEEK